MIDAYIGYIVIVWFVSVKKLCFCWL